MEDNFKLEIISPERIIFSDDTKMVTLPSYEGDMSILKNSTVPSSAKNSSALPSFFSTLTIPGLKNVIIEIWFFSTLMSPSYDGSVTMVVLSEKITFSGLIISNLKLFSIRLQLPLPFFQLFQLHLQLYPPYKKQLLVNDHIHPYK